MLVICVARFETIIELFLITEKTPLYYESPDIIYLLYLDVFVYSMGSDIQEDQVAKMQSAHECIYRVMLLL